MKIVTPCSIGFSLIAGPWWNSVMERLVIINVFLFPYSAPENNYHSWVETEGKYYTGLWTLYTSVVISLRHISVTAAFVQINGFDRCCMENLVFLVWDLHYGGSTIIVSRIIIVTDTVVERLQIHLCTLNACMCIVARCQHTPIMITLSVSLY